MKKLILFSVIISFVLETKVIAQVTNGTNTSTFNPEFLGWDNGGVSKNLEIRNDFNQQIHTYTNNLLRIKLMAGGNGNTEGRMGIGNILPAFFTPVDRLHLHQFAPSLGDFNGVRFTNRTTGGNATDGSRIGILDLDGFFLQQYEVAPIIFESPDSRNAGTMTNWLHIANGLTGYAGYSSDGYVGLNEDSAKFHLDIKTPFKNFTGSAYGGELFLSCRPSDVPDSRMGMLNVASGNGIFVPSLFGNMDATQTGSALNTLAVISPSQDLNVNIAPVQRFIVGKDWEYNTNAIDAISEIENRNAFSWQNVGSVKMLMNAIGRVEIGTAISLSDTITNRLVITSSTLDPGLGLVSTIGGSSGLQFTNLTASTPPLNTNPGLGVLVVDSVGNVIYVNADSIGSGGSGGGGMGSACGSGSPAQLTADSEIQLNNFDFHFTGNGGTMQQNNVGIGTNCLNPLAGKLHVYQTTTDSGTTGAYVLNTDNTSPPDDNSSIGLYAQNSGETIDLATCRTVAAWFETNLNVDGSQNIAINIPQDGGVVSVGFSQANAAANNVEPDVCAVWNTGNILEVNGPMYATLYNSPSDLNFKTNITPITNALQKVKKLNGVYYDYDNTNYPNLDFSTDRQVGLIAQNVDTVLTEVTEYDSLLQAYTMDYARINALLIEAIKEQQNQIDSMNVLVTIQDSINTNLEDRLATLEACINNIGICNNNSGGNGNKISTQTITLENTTAIVLDQNLPNPFKESTQINYVLPGDVLNAKLLFYDMSGRIINEVNITERGNGTLTVYGENLEKGIYTYSLIADGKLIATKKMVKK